MRLTRKILIPLAFCLASFSDPAAAGIISSSLPAAVLEETAQSGGAVQAADAKTTSEPSESKEPEETIHDPLEPLNRVFFDFNDRLYFWVLKPVATGYKAIVPEPARMGVRNFFSNLATPARLVNCLLQGDFKGVSTETARFGLNTTLGLAGFFDPAKETMNLDKKDEDLGQTLGFYGAGPSFYINWPFLGPSSLRDTVGLVGDLFLDPLNYLVPSVPPNIGVRAYDQVNHTSLTIGEYEDLKKGALDPYLALRDSYYQYRRNKVKEH
jgi:phospholipid-binding lipoprotein MlaA